MSHFEAKVNYCGNPDCDHNHFCRCTIEEEVQIEEGKCKSYTDAQTKFQRFQGALYECFGSVDKSVVCDIYNHIHGLKVKGRAGRKEESEQDKAEEYQFKICSQCASLFESGAACDLCELTKYLKKEEEERVT